MESHIVSVSLSNYEPNPNRHKVVSLGRVMFDFVSASSSTFGEVETFSFTFANQGLLVFLGHCYLWCNSRIPHFHHVAARHAFDFCVGLKLKYPSLIKILFPLQALDQLICLYSFSLG